MNAGTLIDRMLKLDDVKEIRVSPYGTGATCTVMFKADGSSSLHTTNETSAAAVGQAWAELQAVALRRLGDAQKRVNILSGAGENESEESK